MKIEGEELERIHEMARECADDNIDLEELAEEIYNGEDNFNNADPSSGQRCWNYDEIEEAVLSYDPVERLMNDITNGDTLHIIRQALEEHFDKEVNK